ncbi:MAG: 2-hydroxyglutaryl-CoA dehydratase [Acutalibacteraceae bacterium]
MAELKYSNDGRLLFTREMKKEYTILLPMMLPIHFKLLQNTLECYGYKTVLLESCEPEIIQESLRYVHNDTCYPAILVIGQFIHALKSGKYDVNKTALMITQTGGGCRASNYIHLLRKALKKAGFENVPVISLNLSGLEKNSGFKLSFALLRRMIGALVYGDLLMNLNNQVMPYEICHGDSASTVEKWIKILTKQLNCGRGINFRQFAYNMNTISDDFAKIKTRHIPKVRVGVVGEIYVKYSSLGNNQLEDFLASQNCEVCVPGILGFLLFKIDNRIEDVKLYGGSHTKSAVAKTLMAYIEKIESILISAIKRNSCFEAPATYEHTKALAHGIIGYGNKMGEGWFLTAEMLKLVEAGYENIVCAQPFGCLPNHICGKGMIRKIQEVNPRANIVAIDYDPGSPKVNQENRIKLMLSIAKEKLCENGKRDFSNAKDNAEVYVHNCGAGQKSFDNLQDDAVVINI